MAPLAIVTLFVPPSVTVWFERPPPAAEKKALMVASCVMETALSKVAGAVLLSPSVPPSTVIAAPPKGLVVPLLIPVSPPACKS